MWSLLYLLVRREVSYRWFGYYHSEGLVGKLESVILGADMGEGDGVGANQFEVLKGVQSRRL